MLENGQGCFVVTIDLDTSKIVSDDPTRYIPDLCTMLALQCDEIKYGLASVPPGWGAVRHLLLKALTVELCEFHQGCQGLAERICRAVIQLNKLYADKGRPPALRAPAAKVTQLLRDPHLKGIRAARNQVAAHRYTGKAGDFITIGQAMRHWGCITEPKLNRAFQIAQEAFKHLERWVGHPKNKAHLALLTAAAKDSLGPQ